MLIPFLDAIRRSFFDALGGDFAGLVNFRTVVRNEAFRLACGNMGIFLLVCLPILLAASLLLAELVQRLRRPPRFLRAAYLLPMAVPVASVVLLWQALFQTNGTLNHLLSLLGLEGRDWMNTGAAMGVLVVSYLWRNLGYDMILWLAGLSAIQPELYESAQVDGAGRWRCFVHITLPLLKPTAFTVIVLSLLNAFKVFREAYLVAGPHPHNSIYLLQHLFNNWFLNFEVQKMCAGAVLVALFMLAVVMLLQGGLGRGDVDG